MAEIDNLAFVLVREFNAIHNRGLNLEGESSGDLFRAIDVRITPNPVNTGSASTELTVTDYNLVGSERVTFTYDSDAAIWNGRNDFGKIVASGRGQITLPGIAINFLGQPAAFDQFIYDPVTSSAAGVSVVIKRLRFRGSLPLLVRLIPAMPARPSSRRCQPIHRHPWSAVHDRRLQQQQVGGRGDGLSVRWRCCRDPGQCRQRGHLLIVRAEHGAFRCVT